MTGSNVQTTDSRTLLLVEDNPGDVRLFEEAFGTECAAELHVVSTGEDALDFVHRRGAYADAPRPDLIFLDWHLRRLDGNDVLAALNDDPSEAYIPIIVLTGSQSEREVREAYEANANACITKTADPAELEAKLHAAVEFWLSIAEIPSSGGNW